MTVGSIDNVYKSWNPLSPLWLMIGNEHKDYVIWETFFFLRLDILCSRQERAYLIFCGTGTHVYGCINMVHVCMNLWLVTYLWSAHLFSFWCNSLFCIFKITTGHNIYIKFFHVHSYAFSFLLLRFYPIQSIYKYLHFIHMMYRDDINI